MSIGEYLTIFMLLCTSLANFHCIASHAGGGQGWANQEKSGLLKGYSHAVPLSGPENYFSANQISEMLSGEV